MVHALREIWRVLGAEGCLLDLRPQVADRLFEVVIDGQGHAAGLLDNSPFIPDAAAADAAMKQMVEEGCLIPIDRKDFTCLVYWNSLDDLITYHEQQDRVSVIITENVVKIARQLSGGRQPVPPVRITTPLSLTVYRKVSPCA